MHLHTALTDTPPGKWIVRRRRFAIKFEYHILTSLAIGLCAYAFFRSLAMAAGILIGGVLIDLDHFVEYFFFRGVRLDFKELFHLSYNNLFPKIYILLHSYEILIGMWLAYLLGFRNPFFLGLAIGITIHMIFDHIFNSARIISYFFIYRVAKRFDAHLLYRPGTVIRTELLDSPIRSERDSE